MRWSGWESTIVEYIRILMMHIGSLPSVVHAIKASSSDVKKRYPLSPMLFNIVAEKLIAKFNNERSGVTVRPKCV